MLSAKYSPMPTPMPASWLRAIVAIANPTAALHRRATAPAARAAGRGSAGARPAAVIPLERHVEERGADRGHHDAHEERGQDPDHHDREHAREPEQRVAASGSRPGRRPP